MAEGRKHVENRVKFHGRSGKDCGKQGKAPWQKGESSVEVKEEKREAV
jgi:hypothetical protein